MRPRFSKLRSWLCWALALAPAGVAAQPAPPRFSKDVEAFAALDRMSPPGACPVLFVGSSSFRLWTSLTADMAPMAVLNRGFGGAEIADVNQHFDRLVRPYAPRAIVFYAGENDLAAGKTPEQVVADFQHFMDLKTQALGETPVFFISLKPSRLRFDQFPAQTQVNAQARALAEARPDLEYLDVVQAMMQDGQPKPIFAGDGLHMAPEGYALWRATVGAALSGAHLDALPCPQETTVTAAEKTDPG